MSQFLMPSLGADMEAGVLVEQLRNPGDRVARGDIIAAVETQKGVIEIEVFEDGVLGDWLVDLGTEVAVGTPLAEILTGARAAQDPQQPEVPQPTDPQPGIAPPEQPPPQDPGPQPPGPELPPPDQPTPEIPQPSDGGVAQVQDVAGQTRLRITPSARRLAAQKGIDVKNLARASDGPLYLKDIAALTPTGAQPQPSEMRRAIAAAMSRSKREIPHYYLSHRADLTDADAFVRQRNATRPPESRLMLGALYVRAVARAVAKYPEFNGHYENDAFAASAATHVGLAVSLRGGGLVAPAIFDADTRDLDDVMTTLRDLIARVRAGRFRARELSDATITVTSLGERGVDQLYGVIYPPQVAIVGIGTPALTPWVKDGDVVARLTATLTLAADHRVSDGRRGAAFLQAIVKHLQTPEAL